MLLPLENQVPDLIKGQNPDLCGSLPGKGGFLWDPGSLFLSTGCWKHNSRKADCVSLLSLCLQTGEEREGATLIQKCPALLPMTYEAAPQPQPEAAEPLEMALLSSVLAACSYISGGCWSLLARAVTWY